MKHKKLIVSLCLFVAIVFGVLIWWNSSYPITNISPSRVSKIEIFNGNTGEAITITDATDIKHIIDNLNSVSLKKFGISLGYMGISFKTKIYKTNGNVYKQFIINSKETIRKDPFFYQDSSKSIDYDYIKALFNKATELIDGDKHITKEMHDVISKYIVERYSSIYNDTQVQFEVHKAYGTSEKDGVFSVYMWSYFGGFNKSTGRELHGCHSLPAVMRLKKDDGGYSVIEYIEPQDGSFFQSSLKKMFPEKYLNSLHKDAVNKEDLQTKMDKKVDEWLSGEK